MDVKPAPTSSLQQSKEGDTKKITSICHSSEEAVLKETLIAGANCNMVFIPHLECMLSLGTQQMDWRNCAAILLSNSSTLSHLLKLSGTQQVLDKWIRPQHKYNVLYEKSLIMKQAGKMQIYLLYEGNQRHAKN